MIGVAFLGGGIVGAVIGAIIAERYNRRIKDGYMQGMHDGYWIGAKNEINENNAGIKPLERRAKK